MMTKKKIIFILSIEKCLKKLNGVNSNLILKIKMRMIMNNLRSLQGLATAIQAEKLLMISIISG